MNTTVNTTSNHSATSSMEKFRTWKLSRLLRNTRGASFVEYLVLVGVVALAGITAMNKIKDGINEKAGNHQEAIKAIQSK